MENKYDRFFESVKSFVLETGLSYPKDLEGLPQDQIRLIGKRYGVSLPLTLWSYLSHFGKKCKIINTDYYLDFSQKMIDNVMQDIEECELFYRVSEQPDIKNILDHKNYSVGEVLDLNTIIFTQLLEHLDIFIFIECKDENPMVQHFKKLYDERTGGFCGYGYHPGELSFVGTFRYLLFVGIYSKLYGRDFYLSTFTPPDYYLEKFDRINIDNVEWIKYYQKHREKPYFEQMGSKEKIKTRMDFCRLADRQAEETGIVMTINEFEWAFLEYLRGLGVDI